MDIKTKIISVILLTAFFNVSCSTKTPMTIEHKSEQAFLEWWKTPHYNEAAFMSFDSWYELDKERLTTISNVRLSGTERAFSILKWDSNEWLFVFSQSQGECEKQQSWIVQMPENTWTPLNHELSRDLCIGDFKYSDVTESSVNFYWFKDPSHPMIEVVTNGPARTTQYLYTWHPDENTYTLFGKNWD